MERRIFIWFLITVFAIFVWALSDIYQINIKMYKNVIRNTKSISYVNSRIKENRKILFFHEKLLKSLVNIVDSQSCIISNSVDESFDPSLIKSNLLLVNLTIKVMGSGTVINIKGQKYILTAGHLLENKDDDLVIVTKKGKYIPLEVVKFSKKVDLLLLKTKKVELLFPAVEISNKYPPVGSTVYVVGNPADLTDMVTKGILSNNTEDLHFYFCSVPSFFGNSGGAVYYKNKLVGVSSFILPLSEFLTHSNEVTIIQEQFLGVVNLQTIKDFLSDV